MRLDRFDLNLLVALDVLLDERNVTRAADRLRLGQSATSAALARLREFFADELLTPVGRQFELTPLAQALVEPVKDTLIRARAAISTKPDFDPAKVNRTFRICASDYVTYVLVSRVAIELARRAAGFQLEISHLPKHVEQVFQLGDIDLMILPELYASRIPHPQMHLLSDDHVCLMDQARKLRRGRLTEDDYFAAGHVSVRLGEPGTHSFEELFFPRAGRQRNVASTVDSFCVLPKMLCGTDRIATVHRLLAQDLARHYAVKYVDFPFEIPKLKESMIWPSFRDQDPSHRFLRGVFEECARQIAADR
ncbi:MULTISPECIES: LysR family transcriptional regulator [unclassified Bradyrhizobium]|uniref:LysR family transcriptional regulator n=1 Tax=unclassified Bradyrhizobium TaxID=2631580 RepID=UPI0028E42250|nr:MULTISPECIES: LysR family transcriptional regulator [unclassified Bradyrhizobium]